MTATPFPSQTDDAARARWLDRAPIMIWHGDDQGNCGYFNAAWLSFTGLDHAAQLDLGWTQCVHPDDLRQQLQPFLDKLARHRSFRLEYRLRRHDGVYRTIQSRVEPLHDEAGVFNGYVGYAVDMTELTDAREAEAAARARLELAIAGANEGIWDRPDLKRDEEYWSPRFYELLGYENGAIEASVSQLKTMVHPDDAAELKRRIDDVLQRGQLYSFEYRIRTADGSYRWFHSRAIVVRDDNNVPIRMTGSLADVHDRKLAEQALKTQKNQAEITLSALAEGVITVSADGRIDYMNGAARHLAGDANGDFIGELITSVFALTLEDGTALDLATLTTPGPPNARKMLEAQLQQRPGRRATVEIACAPLDGSEDDAADSSGTVIVLRDVTESRRMARRMAHQATHDPLTNLVNRREFERRLKRILNSARAEASLHALCYIDLDQFKVINDSCGHSAGDELLKQLAKLFRSSVRKRDTVCRLGGDEFGVLMEHCDLEHAEIAANMLREKIQNFRFHWQDRTFAVGTSIGVVMIDADSDDLAGVLRRADAACYAAKDQGRNRVHVYHDDDVELARMRSEMRWVSRLNNAIENDGFSLHVQPVRAADNGEEPYYEFLLRLHEDGQIILPGQFLPAAERYDLSVKIDRWVVSEALRLLHADLLPGGPTAIWAINLSGASLGDEAFADWVVAALENSGVSGERLCFEVTETAAISNFNGAMDFFARLTERGCRLALDDFGSGLSSFAYLKSLPVDFIKIDGMFVRDLETDPMAAGIIKAIVEIGHLAGTPTIAEFVENERTAAALAAIGADFLQGFHIGHPRALGDPRKNSKSAG